jgi:hypothetical protein
MSENTQLFCFYCLKLAELRFNFAIKLLLNAFLGNFCTADYFVSIVCFIRICIELNFFLKLISTALYYLILTIDFMLMTLMP